MPQLSEYSQIRSHLLVKVNVEFYKTTPAAEFESKVLTFSDLNRNSTIEFEGDTYMGLGKLMGITAANSELQPSSSELSITLSGIAPNSIFEIVNSKIKGCPVWIYRAVFDPATNTLIQLPANPFERFRGFVNNYTLTEDYDVVSRRASNTLTLICKSNLDVMQNKITGRLTNPSSWKRYSPTDLCMDRVPALQDTSFNFGAPIA
jgi:hypothetical protein